MNQEQKQNQDQNQEPDIILSEKDIQTSMNKGLSDTAIRLIDNSKKVVSAGIAVTAALMVLLKKHRK